MEGQAARQVVLGHRRRGRPPRGAQVLSVDMPRQPSRLSGSDRFFPVGRAGLPGAGRGGTMDAAPRRDGRPRNRIPTRARARFRVPRSDLATGSHVHEDVMTPTGLASPFHRAAYLTGPTASGKTAVAVALARRLGAEIVAMDSMTLYRGMDIGTAKPTLPERQGVPHHLLDVLDP